MPASPQVPARRPCHDAPCACAQSSISAIPSERQYAAICSTSNAMWPPMCTRNTACGLCLCALRSKSSNDMQRSWRLQSTNSTRPPAAWIASGVAMNVFDGQRTVRPRTSRNSSAASAAPGPVPVATAGRPFQALHDSSNWRVSGPSDHCSASSADSQSACRRTRSRWSKPMANESKSMVRGELDPKGRRRPGGTNHTNPDGFLNGSEMASDARRGRGMGGVEINRTLDYSRGSGVNTHIARNARDRAPAVAKRGVDQ